MPRAHIPFDGPTLCDLPRAEIAERGATLRASILKHIERTRRRSDGTLLARDIVEASGGRLVSIDKLEEADELWVEAWAPDDFTIYAASDLLEPGLRNYRTTCAFASFAMHVRPHMVEGRGIQVVKKVEHRHGLKGEFLTQAMLLADELLLPEHLMRKAFETDGERGLRTFFAGCAPRETIRLRAEGLGLLAVEAS